MAQRALTKRLAAVVSDAAAEFDSLTVHYAPVRGWPAELVDRIPLAPFGELAFVAGVGRWLRMLRAARVRIDGDPYELCRNAERAAELARRCIGTTLQLVVARRLERSLTLWTDTGVQHFNAVIDFTESVDGLWIRRRGGGPLLHVARETLIRFESAAQEHLEVVSVDGSRRCA
ncbi:MAG: hypothetical protein ACHQ6T_10665 [Myxococcota bacterium]